MAVGPDGLTDYQRKMNSQEKCNNFMRQFRDDESRELKKLTANQFMEVWSHYDADGNGYIEGSELDGFLKEFVSSVNANDAGPESVSDAMLVELKECFMEAYDDNQDGKIEIRELAQLLPMEENFLLLFRFDNPLESSVEFMKIWKQYDADHNGFIDSNELKIWKAYDKDNSGYIEADELKNFLRDLLKEAKKDQDVSEDKLIEYTDTMLQVFDQNKDGKLQLSEMANQREFPVPFGVQGEPGNTKTFLSRWQQCHAWWSVVDVCWYYCVLLLRAPVAWPIENVECPDHYYTLDSDWGASKLTKEDIERVFALYDRDYDALDLQEFQDAIMRGCDFNKDGKINKKELTMILLALAKHGAEDDMQTGTGMVANNPLAEIATIGMKALKLQKLRVRHFVNRTLGTNSTS
ncbi:Calbindin-32-like [Homarus americanus]|uniref:Calbindin-32-like n=1 Tax=Homarus americanus TaxID=6706 RepID=A0A8J5MK99_HOMAM|nr:Calbindin-32-like [Homarus americanus]